MHQMHCHSDCHT